MRCTKKTENRLRVFFRVVILSVLVAGCIIGLYFNPHVLLWVIKGVATLTILILTMLFISWLIGEFDFCE